MITVPPVLRSILVSRLSVGLCYWQCSDRPIEIVHTGSGLECRVPTDYAGDDNHRISCRMAGVLADYLVFEREMPHSAMQMMGSRRLRNSAEDLEYLKQFSQTTLERCFPTSVRAVRATHALLANNRWVFIQAEKLCSDGLGHGFYLCLGDDIRIEGICELAVSAATEALRAAAVREAIKEPELW